MHWYGRARGLALLSFLVAVGCSSQAEEAPTWPAPRVDLRADVNRNGVVDLDDPTEDKDEESWDDKHGAIFLANIDDDQKACSTTDESGKLLSDYLLPACNDAANDVVDGADDLLDLARLKTVAWPDAPSGAIGTVTVDTAMVRLFKKGPDGFVLFDTPNATLTGAELAAGVELAIEAKDVVRDRAAWDGFVNVTFRVTFAGEGKRPAFDEKDVVRMRVAPVVLSHHGSAATAVFATRVSDDGAFRRDLAAAVTEAKIEGGLNALSVAESDPWTQDFFETGFMSMPGAGGAQQVMRVVVRSSNVYNPRSKTFPLRAAGRVVWTAFRGKDVAGLQEFDPKSNQDMDTLNSFGNTETIPPYEYAGKSWPLGRVFRGSSPSYYPDKKLAALFESQRVQDPVFVDTSWLLVGHVDETLSFLPRNAPAGPRSFALLANDARAAKKLLEDAKAAGHGDVKMFIDKFWLDYDTGAEIAAVKTVDEVLADVDVMNASAKAAAEVDAQVEILKSETGLADSEIVPIPFLHQEEMGASVAYHPGMVNGIWLDATHYAAPDPHGPLVDGKDILKTAVEQALSPYGVKVSWVEDWDTYHRNAGEVHCGSNVFRAIPSAKWWEAAR